MQRITGDRAALLSAAARLAADAERIAASLGQLPTFPALDGARAKLRQRQAEYEAAEAELNARARTERAADGSAIPDRATRKLLEARERAVEARQAAERAVWKERERAQEALRAHQRQFGAECGEILEGCGFAVEKIGAALMRVSDAMLRHGTTPNPSTRAGTLLGIAQALRSR